MRGVRLIPPPPPSGLVLGFVSLPTFMLSDTTEVLWELLQFAREVGSCDDHMTVM